MICITCHIGLAALVTHPAISDYAEAAFPPLKKDFLLSCMMIT
jgi:hypothetical protein